MGRVIACHWHDGTVSTGWRLAECNGDSGEDPHDEAVKDGPRVLRDHHVAEFVGRCYCSSTRATRCRRSSLHLERVTRKNRWVGTGCGCGVGNEGSESCSCLKETLANVLAAKTAAAVAGGCLAEQSVDAAATLADDRSGLGSLSAADISAVVNAAENAAAARPALLRALVTDLQSRLSPRRASTKF